MYELWIRPDLDQAGWIHQATDDLIPLMQFAEDAFKITDWHFDGVSLVHSTWARIVNS